MPSDSKIPIKIYNRYEILKGEIGQGHGREIDINKEVFQLFEDILEKYPLKNELIRLAQQQMIEDHLV